MNVKNVRGNKHDSGKIVEPVVLAQGTVDGLEELTLIYVNRFGKFLSQTLS